VNLLADDRQGEGALPQHLRHLPNGLPFPNPTGFASTFSTAGRIDLTNEFFQDLGANGHRCVSCHLPSAGWTIVVISFVCLKAEASLAVDDTSFRVALHTTLVN
jgi:hypothetical protein